MLTERDILVDGIPVHLYEAGEGFPILFFHGSGAGVGILSNFRNVLPELAAQFRVVGSDLIGFGKSGLKPERPYFDLDLWLRQISAVIDDVGAERVALVGHSLSGSFVLKAAAIDKRVAAVVTTGTMGAASEYIANGPRWKFPAGREAVRAAVERTMFDPALATDDEVERRLSVLERPGYEDYFNEMFGGSPEELIDVTAVTEQELAAITCPVVLMHGRQDRSFTPEETSLRLGSALPDADVVVLNRCAHSVAHERSDMFVAVVTTLLRRVT